MAYLLDTCVLSEFQKKRPDPKAIAWLDAQLEDALFISVLTVAEIQKGIAFLPISKRRTDYQEWLEALIYRYDTRILPLTVSVAQRWGELTGTLEKTGRVLPVMDGLIAATALVHRFTLVTRNVSDFAGAGVSVLNIWE
jgi:predicted nucleic acid-binding protein